MSYIAIIISFFINNPAIFIRISPSGNHGVVKLSCCIDTGSSSCKGIFKLTLVYNIVNSCNVEAGDHGVLVVLWYLNLFNSIFLEVMGTNNNVSKLTIF